MENPNQKWMRNRGTPISKQPILSVLLLFQLIQLHQHEKNICFPNSSRVGGFSPTPLKNMTFSIGMMTFPIQMEKKIVPNHQPVVLVTSPCLRTISERTEFSF